jgi:hypothetical protein
LAVGTLAAFVFVWAWQAGETSFGTIGAVGTVCVVLAVIAVRRLANGHLFDDDLDRLIRGKK